MPTVKFTSALSRFFPDLGELVLDADTVADVLMQVEQKFPGIKNYIVDEHGALRKHVNIFVNEDLIYDKIKLSDKVDDKTVVYFMQALSGG